VYIISNGLKISWKESLLSLLGIVAVLEMLIEKGTARSHFSSTNILYDIIS